MVFDINCLLDRYIPNKLAQSVALFEKIVTSKGSFLPFVLFSLFISSICGSLFSLDFSWGFSFFKLELWEVIQSLAKRYTAYFLKGDINFIVQRSCNSFNFPCLAWLDLQFFSSGEKWILFCYSLQLVLLDWK